MQLESTQFRNLCNIYRKKSLALLLALVFLSFGSQAQINRHNYNYLDFQKKPYYFGITLGINTSAYKINHSSRFTAPDQTINVAESVVGPGFNLQIITNFKIGEYFDLRFVPGFSFAERNLEYRNSEAADSNFTRRKVESIYWNMPFLVRYKSAPYKDKRAFVIAGVNYNYDIASNSKTRQADSLVKISPHDFQLEVGAGIQFFFPYFIFSPELKLSTGLGNILIFNDNLNESSVLEKLKSRVFTISFHIEG